MAWNLIGILLYGLISLLLIFTTFEDPLAVLTFVAPAFAAWLIWRFVRWLNRRDDPRVNPPAPNLNAKPE